MSANEKERAKGKKGEITRFGEIFYFSRAMTACKMLKVPLQLKRRYFFILSIYTRGS